MKEVPQKDLPEVSGGDAARRVTTPPTSPYYPQPIDYPRNPFGPMVEERETPSDPIA